MPEEEVQLWDEYAEMASNLAKKQQDSAIMKSLYQEAAECRDKALEEKRNIGNTGKMYAEILRNLARPPAMPY